MMVTPLDSELLRLHRAATDLQIPIRKAAHVEAMTTGVPTKAAPRGSSSSGSSYSGGMSKLMK